MNDSKEPLHVFGITEADFQSWKHNPVTKMFRQYLRHYADELERGHLMRWKAGAMEQGKEDESVGRVNTCEDMIGLEFEDIHEFYHSQEQQETNETETLRDPAGEI